MSTQLAISSTVNWMNNNFVYITVEVVIRLNCLFPTNGITEKMEKYTQLCNVSSVKQMPQHCYHRRKLKLPLDIKEKEANRKYIASLGIDSLHELSLWPHDERVLKPKVELVVLVIVRWDDSESRMFLRKTLSQQNMDFVKLMFVFGIPNSASGHDLRAIKIENDFHQDMIIPEVEDNYHTVSYKLFAAFKWILNASQVSPNHLQWILKLDDDVLLNLKQLSTFAKQVKNKDVIYCKVYPVTFPFSEDPSDKW